MWEEEAPTQLQTGLPAFPSSATLLGALRVLGTCKGSIGKADFLAWVHATLERPDEIWEAGDLPGGTVCYYVNFIAEYGNLPAFVVEAHLSEDVTEITDFSVVTSEKDFVRVCSGDLVFSLAEEWEREEFVRDLNDRALKKYDEDRLEEARELIDRAIGLSGTNRAYLFNNRGLIQWKMGFVQYAKQDFLEAIRLDRENGDSHFNLGLIFFDECDYSQAMIHLHRSVEINPSDSQFLTELGHLHLDLGREQEALRFFAKARENNPDDAQVDFHLGFYFLYKRHEPWKAVKYYTNGLNKDPEDQFALADLAVAHWILGHGRKARGIRKLLERFACLMPYTISRLVDLTTQMGDYEGALKYYHRALGQADPFEPEWLHYHAALVYAKTDHLKKALHTLSLAVRAGGEAVIERALSDKELRQLKGTAAFKKLLKLHAKRKHR